MNPKHLQDAIGNIDDAYIEEAAKAVIIRPKVWVPAAALAASFLLIAALLPWKVIFSESDPSLKDPVRTDFLQNDETSSFDTTGKKDEPPLLAPDSTQNNVPSTQAPDTSKGKDTNNIFTPPVTLPPIPETHAPAVDTPEKPDSDETTANKEETTGPLIPEKPNTPDNEAPPIQQPTILSHTVYPVYAMYPATVAQRDEWRVDLAERINGYKSGIGNTDGFVTKTVSEFFSNSENKNLVYSPVNVYMALGMLAETASGNSRDQLLDLFLENDICSLRSSAKNLWNSCYRDDGIVTSIPGSSMWLDNSFVPKTDVTDILSNDYYASSFYGDMGSKEYNDLMRSWVNEQTMGLLSDKISSSTFDPESTMSLLSTVYFKANWEDVRRTTSKEFHYPDRDLDAEFLRKEQTEVLYEGENFKATRLTFKEGGSMWFLLPDEDVSMQSLFSDSEAMEFITGKAQRTLSLSRYNKKMVLYLPQFDITSEIDIVKGLKNLGITDVFDSDVADFSSLTDSKISVSEINHSVRVRIDENGCEAAQIIENVLPPWWNGGLGATRPMIPVEFTLDRPFIFVVTSDSDFPLFVGTVTCPTVAQVKDQAQN